MIAYFPHPRPLKPAPRDDSAAPTRHMRMIEMADAMIDLTMETGSASHDDLIRAGFAPDEIAELGDRARAEAQRRQRGESVQDRTMTIDGGAS